MNAAILKEIDYQEKIHALAWLIRQAKATRKNGKPIYRKFSSFFNKKKIEDAYKQQNSSSENGNSIVAKIKNAYKAVYETEQEKR